MLKIPAPRLLPATITAMAALLLLKSGLLLQVAVSHGSRPNGLIVAVANAAGAEAAKEKETAEKPHAKPASGSSHGAPATAEAAPPPAAQQPPPGPPPISDSEKALLQELRQRRQELDARADTVSTRESVMAATEQKLAARVSEMQTIQKKLEALDGARKQKEDAGWQGLVKLYETMKPKDAATIFNDLSMPVLLQVLDRMKDSKAAAIMAAMNPDKARDVTAELAQLRTGRDITVAPLAASK
jgi:flagellar motility protein MotE (MotC chaperone)